MYNFFISLIAQQEAKDLANWYEDIDSYLGDKFRNEYEIALKKIVTNPTHFYFISKELRRCKFPKLKAIIIYKFENEFIEILSVKDSRSKPNKKYY